MPEYIKIGFTHGYIQYLQTVEREIVENSLK